MHVSADILQKIKENAQRRRGDGSIGDERRVGYAVGLFFFAVMVLCLGAAIGVFGVLLDVSVQKQFTELSAQEEILFLRKVHGWFGIPIGFAALAVAYAVTAICAMLSPWGERSAAQSIVLAEEAHGANAGLTVAFNRWIMRGIDDRDPEKYLTGYWRSSAALGGKVATFLMAAAILIYWVEASVYMAVTPDGVIAKKTPWAAETLVPFERVERIEVGCRHNENQGSVTTRFRYTMILPGRDEINLYTARLDGSRLSTLERVDALALAAGVPVVHANVILNKADDATVDAACTERVIDRYKRSNETRAFKLLRLPDPRGA